MPHNGNVRGSHLRGAAAALLVAGATSACDSMVGPGDERQTLRDNRRLFSERVGTSYSYDYRNVRFAVGPVVEPVRIRVRNSVIVSVVSISTGRDAPPDAWRFYETVEGVFRALEDAYARNAAQVQVEYHPQLGYPTDVYIDYDQRLADEEAGYVVANLVRD
jgi:hypothetical protein